MDYKISKTYKVKNGTEEVAIENVAYEEGAVVTAAGVAKIGSTEYETLEAAFAAATDGATITLLADCAGNGIKVPQGKYTTGLTVDFGGFTYTVDGETVGSTGTETNGFQLLKGNNITFKNGTITSTKAKILVQNYSNLTLEGMTLTLNNPNYASAYTLSNNNGNTVINSTTINANPAGGFAFDVCRYSSYPSVSVEVKGSSVINGNVEISASKSDAKDGFGLKLTSGTLNGDIVVDASAAAAMKATPEKATVTKANTFTKDAPAGYKWEGNGEGTSKLVAIDYVAQIGDTKYETLEAAFAAATDGATITLLANCAGNGIKVPQGKYTTGLTVDFGGHTYTVDGATVGSTGTETQAFQLLKDNKITFQNGTIYSEKALFLVQNYSNLTLEGMTLTLNNANYTSAYTLSNNNGNVVIDGTTINANPAGGFAFDVCRYASYSSVNVEVKGSSVINGNVEISATGSDAKDGFGLKLTSGTLNGNIVVDASAAAAMKATPEKATVTKANTFSQDAPEGYKWEVTGETSKLVAIDYVAQIGTAKYETLEAAFAAATDGATITLLADCAGNGIKVLQGKYTTGLTVDFGGFTYTVDGATVGSTGTETQAFQLLKDNKITFQNGTIYSEKALFLVQNYSNLTLEGMTLTLNNANYTSAYTLSNNNGNVVIDGTTINANPAGGFAFDVCRYASYPSVSVTVTGESKINGDVEISASGSDPKNGLSLNLNGGTMTGDIVVDATAATIIETTPEKAVVTKADAFDKTAPEGYEWKDNSDGTSTLVEKSEYIFTDGTDTYTITTEKNNVSATYKRDFTDRTNKFQGWLVPFDYTITDTDIEKFEFREISKVEFADENKTKMQMRLGQPLAAGTTLEANKPYVFVPTTDVAVYEFTATSTILKAADADAVRATFNVDDNTVVSFYGVYTSAHSDGNSYIYYMGKSGNIGYSKKNNLTVGSFRWIFKITDGVGNSPSFAYTFGVAEDNNDDVTAVSSAAVEAEGEVVAYYTLAGQKVSEPTKGVYVVKYANGTSKKVVF